MLILKVLSALLNYPNENVIKALDEIAAVIKKEAVLTKSNREALLSLIAIYGEADLLDLQERYSAIFDRGRFFSLHIFEHVHGESRERGQAMVNLLKLYEAHGFVLHSRELPDYIPLFLEFLSQLDNRGKIVDLLQDAMPILALLGARLQERESDYQAIFHVLIDIAGVPEGMAEIRRRAKREGEDESIIHMDDIWE